MVGTGVELLAKDAVTTRKYISEFGLVSTAAYRLLLQQDALSQVPDLGFKPHIYFVGKRPRILLKDGALTFTDGSVSGVFLIQRGPTVEEIPFVTRNELGTTEVSVECSYPYTEFAIRDKQGVVISNGKVALMMALANYEFWDKLDLEVLYIGQAFGEAGERTADIRLASHSTLQQIYSEAIRKSPDYEIWLLLCSFDMQLLASFDGRSKNIGTTNDEDDEHIRDVLSTEINEQQIINFTEAALIRYFQPEYNVTYKETFPSPAHSTYSQCYDVDINMVIVEINTEELMFRLWSTATKPKWTHFGKFPLHSSAERKAMFDVF